MGRKEESSVLEAADRLRHSAIMRSCAKVKSCSAKRGARRENKIMLNQENKNGCSFLKTGSSKHESRSNKTTRVLFSFQNKR